MLLIYDVCLPTSLWKSVSQTLLIEWINFCPKKIWSLCFFLFYKTRIFDAKLECQGYICLQSSINVHAFVINRCGLEKHYLLLKAFIKYQPVIYYRLYFKFLKPVLSGIHIQSITIIKEFVFLSVCIID